MLSFRQQEDVCTGSIKEEIKKKGFVISEGSLDYYLTISRTEGIELNMLEKLGR